MVAPVCLECPATLKVKTHAKSFSKLTHWFKSSSCERVRVSDMG